MTLRRVKIAPPTTLVSFIFLKKHVATNNQTPLTCLGLELSCGLWIFSELCFVHYHLSTTGTEPSLSMMTPFQSLRGHSHTNAFSLESSSCTRHVCSVGRQIAGAHARSHDEYLSQSLWHSTRRHHQEHPEVRSIRSSSALPFRRRSLVGCKISDNIEPHLLRTIAV